MRIGQPPEHGFEEPDGLRSDTADVRALPGRMAGELLAVVEELGR